MTLTKKTIFWGALLIILILIFIAFSVHILKHSRGRIPALSFGGKNLHIMLPDNYNWQQKDKRWQIDLLGDNKQGETLGKYGCTVSAIANAISNLGLNMTPQELNQKLTQKNGFNDRGWLIWGAINSVTDSKIKATAFASPSRKDIDHCLSDGQYPIVKYLIGGKVQHWVTIVGKKDGRYLMRDPLIAAQEPVILSKRTPIILAVRCIGKTTN